MENNWQTKKLKDYLKVNYGKALVKKDRVSSGDVNVFASSGIVGKHDKSLVTEPTVIVGRKGAVGKTYVSTDPSWVIDTAFFFTNTSGQEVEWKYIYYNLKQYEALLHSQDTSTAIPGLRRQDLEETKLYLPNYETQQAIAQKLDSLFSKIDAGKEGLQHVQQQLEVYRQAVLKGVFDGTFSKSLINQDTLKPPINKELYGSNEVPYTLPENWRWVKFVDIGELGRGKSKHRPRNDKRLFGGKYPFIQTGDVRKARKWLSSYTQTYSDFGLQQSKLWPAGTLMITIAANIAETAILEIDACFPDSVVGFIPNQELCNVEYTEFFIRTIKDRLETFAPATAQKNINLRILNDVYIPLPPLEEQKIIVDAVNKLMSISYVVEETISKSKTMSQSLRQSILKKAFNGELI